MEGELIIVSVISLIGCIIVTQLFNHNWFRRQNMKYGHEANMYKLRKSYSQTKTPPSAPASSPISLANNLPEILKLVRGLDPDQLGSLLDIVGGGSIEAEPETASDILSTLIRENPELVQSFVKGLTHGKETSNESMPAFTNE
jgi:hypothetical protein